MPVSVWQNLAASLKLFLREVLDMPVMNSVPFFCRKANCGICLLVFSSRCLLPGNFPLLSVRLKPGAQVSLAVAVWDGAGGDRNGQKSVSIWHQLELE